MLLVACLPLVAQAALIGRVFRRSFAESLPVSVFGTILFLYVCGLFNALRAGVFGVWAIGLVAAVLCAFLFFREWTLGKNRPPLAVTPAFAVFICFIVFSALFTHNRALVVWDEFSHWALVVKNMFYLNAFGTAAGSSVVFRSYPPSIALIEYYFTRSVNQFSEPALFFSKDVLTITLLMPLFRFCRWKNPVRLLLLCVVAFCLPLVEYPYYYTTVIVDGVLGLLFAFVLTAYCMSGQKDAFLFATLALALFVLTAAKPSGFGLAIISVCIICADLIGRACKTALPVPSGPKWRPFAGLALLLAAVLFGKFSWTLHCRLADAAEYWQTASISWSGLSQLAHNVQPYQKQTVFNFYNRLFEPGDHYYAIKLSPLLWVFAILPPAIGCRHLMRDDAPAQKSFTVCIAGLVAFYFVWLGGLLVMYLFLFHPVEAQQLASFNRYVSTFQLGALCFIAAMLIKTLFQDKRRFSTAALAILLCVLSFGFSYQDAVDATVLSMRTNRLSREKRSAYQLSGDVVRALNADTDSVCYVSQERKVEGVEYSGYSYYMARYDLTPIAVDRIESWSYGPEPKFAGDCWTKDLSGAEFSNRLLHAGYTHVYVGHVDAYLLEAFGDVFGGAQNIRENTLYRVVREETTVALSAVSPQE